MEVSEVRKGKVKWYRARWKRGMISPDDGPPDVEFHRQVVAEDVPLEKGEHVCFRSADGQASKVWRCAEKTDG